jgi:hypothetical protein
MNKVARVKLLGLLLTSVLLSLFSEAQIANRFDVVISEIMADPTPQVGLPNNEWIELRNTSTNPINLQGWRIGDASGQSGPMPAFVLQPDSFVIVTSAGAVSAMSVFGRTISVTSFPSLNNDADELYLRSAQGRIIHYVSYTSGWYQNTLKAAGGWTLEIVDPRNPCSGISNWKASIDPKGGTPAKRNSVDAVNNDQTPPGLKGAFLIDNTTIILTFDEPLDSSSAATISRYSISPSVAITSAIALAPSFTQVQLKLSSPLNTSTINTITATGVTDCKGNQIGTRNTVRIGVPQVAAPGDVIINEILFDPKPTGFDYVEFYNRSNKIIDASQLHIANRNSSGAISSLVKLSATSLYIFPGDYIVVTQNSSSLDKEYLVKNPDAVLTLSSLPSFPNDKGTVVLLNFQGVVIDEVAYSEKWHFALIRDAEGVALERIDPNGPSQDKNNWTSAASTAGYGTPGYQNSQYKLAGNLNATVEVSPKVFSPDNDGFNDLAIISYQLSESGFVANINIFDANGRLVRNLVKNDILGVKGSWTWDGLDDKQQKLPIGSYVVFTELFNLNGKRQQFKNVVVLARKLN